jgi:agmatine deiminase
MINRKQLRLPGEWESHEATWLTWPCRLEVWHDYPAICQAYANVINAIAQTEHVYLIVNSEHVAIAKQLCTAHNVTFIDSFRADDSWSRDTSPLFLLDDNKKLLATCWNFNAWGKKFFPYDDDAKLSQHIADYLKVESTSIPMVLEGGSVHSNGQGTLLTTEECLLNSNRNPHLTKTQIEEQLKQTLHADHVIWMDRGLDGDVDTDGHIDNAACFADANTIMIQSCDDPHDPNFAYFQKNKAILQESRDSNGKSFAIHEIPQPPRIFDGDARVPLSYINFYFANDVVIFPTFDAKKADDHAFQLFKDIFPNRTIIPIHALPIVHGGGGIHCITMQQPSSGDKK